MAFGGMAESTGGDSRVEVKRAFPPAALRREPGQTLSRRLAVARRIPDSDLTVIITPGPLNVNQVGRRRVWK